VSWGFCDEQLHLLPNHGCLYIYNLYNNMYYLYMLIRYLVSIVEVFVMKNYNCSRVMAVYMYYYEYYLYIYDLCMFIHYLASITQVLKDMYLIWAR
jgi:hypothetical protein